MNTTEQSLSLEELQQQFIALQQPAQPFQQQHQELQHSWTFSERTCIDIVLQLQQEKKVILFASANGKEFFTPEQIRREILTSLDDHGGRVSAVEIGNALGLSSVLVHAQIEELLKQETEKGKFFFVLGDLLSASLVQHISDQVRDWLMDCGRVEIADLCSKYALPADFLRHELQARLGSDFLAGREYKQFLATNAFTRKVKKLVRGIFNGATCPVRLNTIESTFHLPTECVAAATTEVLKEYQEQGLGGKLHNNVFIPMRYSLLQIEKVTTFYRDNLFIPFSLLAEQEGRSVFVKKAFPEALRLHTVYIHPKLLVPLQVHAQEAAVASWTDLHALLPSCFSAEDKRLLVQRVCNYHERHQQLRLLAEEESGIVFSEEMLERFCHLLEPFLASKAASEEEANAETRSPGACPPEKKKKGVGVGGEVLKGGRGYGGKKAEGSITRRADLSRGLTLEEIEKNMIDLSNVDSRGSFKKSSTTNVGSFVEQRDELRSLWSSMPSFVRDIFWKNFAADRINAIYQKHVDVARRATYSQEAQQQHATNYQAVRLQEDFTVLCLALKALQALSISEDRENPFVSFFFDSLAQRVVDGIYAITLANYAEQGIEAPNVPSNSRTEVLRQMLADGFIAVEALLHCYSMISLKNAAALLPALHAAASECHILLREPNKKEVKSITAAKRCEQQALFASTDPSDPSAVLHAALQLLLSKRLTNVGGFFVLPHEEWATEALWSLLENQQNKLSLEPCEKSTASGTKGVLKRDLDLLRSLHALLQTEAKVQNDKNHGKESETDRIQRRKLLEAEASMVYKHIMGKKEP